MSETWLFYESMELLSHRINFEKIRGPFADFLNNNKDFQILDNDKIEYDDNTRFLSHGNDIPDLQLNSNNSLSKDSDVKWNQSQQQCYNYIDKKKNTSPNRLTIKQFIQSYTNFSENKFDGQQGLKWSSFSKTSQFSSNLFKFDGKDGFSFSFTEFETIGSVKG